MSLPTSKHILVVGGAGFLGSAITKRLVGLGHTITSISPSGRPFLTPSGHQPAWSSSKSVQWRKADALAPETYVDYLNGSKEADGRPVDGVVSTMGVLLEGDYKGPGGSVGGTISALMKGWGLEKGNPLQEQGNGVYERMNRDAALTVARTWSQLLQSSASSSSLSAPPPFVFISAEDIFRPIIDPRYILTKRQAEDELERMSWVPRPAAPPSSSPRASSPSPFEEQETPDSDGAGLTDEINRSTSSFDASSSMDRLFRPIFIRPGLMYHPHTRPLSTLPSTLLDLSSSLHSILPSSLPTPANLLKTIGQKPLGRLLTLSPLHVDTVAKAVGAGIADEAVIGVVGTRRIKQLAGWKKDKLGAPDVEEGQLEERRRTTGWHTQGR